MASNCFVEIVENIVKSTIKWETKYKSFPEALVGVLRCNEQNIVLVDCDTGRQWSAIDLLNAIIKLAVQFRKFGVTKGDVVAFFCPNSDLNAIAKLSLWFIGAVYTGLIHKSPLNELKNIISKTNASFLVGSEETINVCKQFLSSQNSIKKFFLINGSDNENVLSIESMIKQESKEEDKAKIIDFISNLDSNDLCKISFSSGTTGEPKPVMETHGRMIAYLSISPPEVGLMTKNDTFALLQPLQHGGSSIFFGSSLLKGTKVVIFSHFDCENFVRSVIKYSITLAFIIPSNINLLNRAFEKPLESLPLRKVISAGEFLPESSSKEFVHKFKPDYLGQGYGSTESGWTTTVPVSDGVTQLTTVGPPVSGYQIKIIDLENGQILGPNQRGEIYTKGPHATIGYLNNEKATRESFDEQGFFKSGDIGYYDERGYFYCVDRLKEVIKYNSQQVSPCELESLLLKLESVKEVAVVGIPDLIYGELPKAFIVLNEAFKHKVNETDILNYIDNNVSDYKKLRGGVVFLDALPKSALGKIVRKALKSL